MLVVAALVSDHVKAGHAVRKLRERGIPPESIRTVARDPEAAREAAACTGGELGAGTLTGALAGALAGGMGGWVLGASVNPLAELFGGTLAGAGGTALVGLVFGLVVGALLGWLLGWVANRRQVAAYEEGMQAGDLLLLIQVAEAQLRETEELLRSYGARGISAGPARPQTQSSAEGR
jgi:hypothetical protein